MLDILKQLNCKAVYITGSSLLPFIKRPRDTEYYAVFEDEQSKTSAQRIDNVNFIVEGQKIPLQSWTYLLHYLNITDKFVGEKCKFEEPTIDDLQKSVRIYKPLMKKYHGKLDYKVALTEAIIEYGYDDIPQKIIDLINDLHDFKITYEQYKIAIKK